MSQHSLLDSDHAQTINLSDAVSISDASIVSRTLVQNADIRVILFAFAEGQELTAHTSRRRAIVQILDGECDFFFAGRWQRLGAGTLLHLPPAHPHAVRATAGPFSMLLTLAAQFDEPASTPSP
jgi:quercetin dioxygenase-like cupin family protein